MTVSFYVTQPLNPAEEKLMGDSIIKFGSYDRSGLADGSVLTIIKTIKKETWDLRGQMFFTIGGKDVDLSGKDKHRMSVRLSPQLPYIYLSKSRFKMFGEEINKFYKEIDNHEEPCGEQSCVFNKNCAEVLKK